MRVMPVVSNRFHFTVNFKGDDRQIPSLLHKVDDFLYRGERPLPTQVPELKKFNISTVIDFSTENQKFLGYSEKEAVESLQMKYFSIPFLSFENPSDKDIEKFFNISEHVRQNREKMFVHCLGGRDRTGLFVELYKIRYGLSNASESLLTLKRNRYRFSENPLVTQLIEDFAKKLHR